MIGTTMAKKSKFGISTYVKKSKPKIGRHKKRMNKREKLKDRQREFANGNGVYK